MYLFAYIYDYIIKNNRRKVFFLVLIKDTRILISDNFEKLIGNKIKCKFFK